MTLAVTATDLYSTKQDKRDSPMELKFRCMMDLPQFHQI